MQKKIKIAQIIGKWVGGGLEASVMNYYRNLDTKKIQFDFFCDEDSIDIPYEEIKKKGGNVILIPKIKNIIHYNKYLTKKLKEENYDIVHSHMNSLSVFPLRCAKKAKIKVRIAHSHSTTNVKEFKRNLAKLILRPLAKLYPTNCCACTTHSAIWLFGEKFFNQNKVTIINNAIDLEKFDYNKSKRKKQRDLLNIPDDVFVIGHVGRFMTQKNHTFLIDIFNEFHKKYNNSILLLAGQGPLLQKIKDKVNLLGLNECVKFLGQRSDIDELYQAFDILLLPSLYEGLGMCLIEAQVSNLPCVCSSEVPKVAKINNSFKFISLSDPIKNWIKSIEELKLTKRKSCKKAVQSAGYDIKHEVKLLEKYYFSLVRNAND